MHLIFDFDGVIADTLEAAAHSQVAIGDAATVDEGRQNALTYSSNKPNHTRNHSLSDSEIQYQYDWTARYGVAMKNFGFSLFTDFVREIEQLDTVNKAVISSGSQQYIIPALAKTEINPTHVLAFENHHSKEEKIETVCRDWGIAVSDTYYFTDTLADVYELQGFIAPEKLIGVSWGYCTYEQLASELKPEYILKAPYDIRNLFI